MPTTIIAPPETSLRRRIKPAMLLHFSEWARCGYLHGIGEGIKYDRHEAKSHELQRDMSP
jgi:hypothetical protein